MRVGVALGSNLGDRLAHLRWGRAAVNAVSGVDARGGLIAPVYRTEPLDCPPGSGWFLNSVMEIEFLGNLQTLLVALQGIERAAGRSERRAVNAPRPLDLDILYAEDVVMETSRLTLPHPRLSERRFVLTPLSWIRAGLLLPGYSAPVAEILSRLDDDPASVARADEQW